MPDPELTSISGMKNKNPISILRHSYNLDRIADLKNKTEAASIIRSALTKDVTFKGLKEIPNDFIYEDILNMIMKRFKILTPLEIELALEMDRYNELEGKENHYQFYGTEYVGSILKRFVEWKQRKAQELNLNRNTLKLEAPKPDIEKIEAEYKQTILSEIKSGKKLRHINAYKFCESIPQSEKLGKNDGIKLFNHEREVLKKENESKKTKEKDQIRLKNLLETLNNNFNTSLEIRCQNVAACVWLAKNNNIEIKKDQFI